MYEIAICDDDAVFLSDFEKQLKQELDRRSLSYRITCFSSAEALLSAIDAGDSFSLLFLDILFEEEKGIRLARTLRERSSRAEVVFVTGSPDFAVESYDVFPLHYLPKPVDDEKLSAALDRFLERRAPRSILISNHSGIIRVLLSEVLYLEIYGHEIILHKADGTKETCTGTMKEMEEQFPSGLFVRPHRSYLVNMDYISKIGRFQITLSSGDKIPISRNLYQKTQHLFIEFAVGKTAGR